jgi:hypothetical protein
VNKTASWYTLNPEKTAKLVFFVIVVSAVFIGLQTFAQTIDVTQLPIQMQKPFSALIAFMTSGGGLFIVSLGRNLLGYIYVYVGSGYKETYSFKQLTTTWIYYTSFIGSALAFVEVVRLPAPYDNLVVTVVSMVAFVADFVTSELKKGS